MPKGNVTHLYDPCRCLLLTPHYPLCADDARRWVDCPVERVDTDDVCAFRVRVFVPHPDNHMRPWVARQRHKSQPAGILCVKETYSYLHDWEKICMMRCGVGS